MPSAWKLVQSATPCPQRSRVQLEDLLRCGEVELHRELAGLELVEQVALVVTDRDRVDHARRSSPAMAGDVEGTEPSPMAISSSSEKRAKNC